MSHVRHHCIVVTGGKEIKEVRKKAIELGLIVTNCVKSHTNGYLTFFVCPDGSGEGWATSNEFDAKRDAFKLYLDSCRCTFAEVVYGDDYGLRPDVTDYFSQGDQYDYDRLG